MAPFPWQVTSTYVKSRHWFWLARVGLPFCPFPGTWLKWRAYVLLGSPATGVPAVTGILPSPAQLCRKVKRAQPDGSEYSSMPEKICQEHQNRYE